MRKWTRWQDWVAVAAGLYAALSPIWVATTGAAAGSLIVLGVLIIIAAVINLATGRLRSIEWIEALLGALLFVSPWVLGFSGSVGASWASWIGGGLAVVMGVWTALVEQAQANNGTLSVSQHRPVTH